MFEAHEWPERGEKIMPAVQRRVVEVYGSVRSFEEAHKPGDLMFPMEAIKSDPPNVWLTSFYGFRPEEWGFLGFTQPDARNSFLRRSKPGALVVIYGAGEAAKNERGKILGIQQCSHELGSAQDFTSPAEWELKSRDPKRLNRWNLAVRAVRAWRVTSTTRMDVRKFAPSATANEAWEHIGAYGVPLTSQEALNILKLDLQEVEVYGQGHILASVAGTAKEILAPSKAGPVSKNAYVVKEAEGPKHLYVLKLQGDVSAFLGRSEPTRLIVKAGFSKDPQVRCDDHNRALPRCAFRWEVMYSGITSGFSPHPTSDHAKAGERAMQIALCEGHGGESLGGEFFLTEPVSVEKAWKAGNQAATDYKK